MDITTGLELIENAIQRVRMGNMPTLASTMNYLETLHERIVQELGRGQPISLGSGLPVELAETIFLYTHVVCDYFKSLKQIRPLTDEEKYIGPQLAKLLQQTMEGLIKTPQSK